MKVATTSSIIVTLLINSMFRMVMLLGVLLHPSTVSAQENETTGNSILAIARETDELSTLVDLVMTTTMMMMTTTNGLVFNILDGATNNTTTPKNVTFFGPTNNAFDALMMPSDLVTNLMTAGWGMHLDSLLKTHIVDAVVPSSSIANGMTTSLTTLSGEIVKVTLVGPNNTITVGDDGASVIMADIVADNGIVHIIDGVIAPAWLGKTLPVAASEVEEITTLVDLLNMAGLVPTLTEGTYTIFAPTNNAFTSLGEVTVNCVTQNMTVLTAILTYHVLEDGAVVPASQLVSLGTIPTLQGSILSINTTTTSTFLINGGANITRPDVFLANNGIAHLIDAVLVPDSVLPFVNTCIENAPTRAPTAPVTTNVPVAASPPPPATATPVSSVMPLQSAVGWFVTITFLCSYSVLWSW